MAPIPYLLYFPMTDFSLSDFLPWIALAVCSTVALWIMLRELERDIHSQWEEEIMLGHLAGYRLLFAPRWYRHSVLRG